MPSEQSSIIPRTFLALIHTGILNPALLSLLARVRHTNTLVIADRGFPFWPGVEMVDLSLVDDVPTVLQVLKAIQANFVIGRVISTEQFRDLNPGPLSALREQIGSVPLSFEAHDAFKKRVPGAIGLIRTGDTTQYANLIIESA